jgi:hypothetical protein
VRWIKVTRDAMIEKGLKERHRRIGDGEMDDVSDIK